MTTQASTADMSQAFVVREYRPDDRSAIRALVAESFGDPLGFDRLETGNPLGEPLRLVLEMNGEPVGFNQWLPWVIPTPSGVIPVFQSATSVVSPRSRLKGAFSRLLARGTEIARERGIGYFIGFPNTASVRAFVRDGWSIIAELRLKSFVLPGGAMRLRSGAGALDARRDFFSWRYGRISAEASLFTVRGESRIAIFKRARVRGIPVVRLLDVLTEERRRPKDFLADVASHLPALQPVVYRVGGSTPERTPSVAIPGSWRSPVIVKRICGNPEGEAALQRATFVYGDIDAG